MLHDFFNIKTVSTYGHCSGIKTYIKLIGMYLFVKLQSVEGEHHEKAVELLKQAKGNT